MNDFGLERHYHGLIDMLNREFTDVQIVLNENPMYFDEEGNRNIGEPSYQLIIRAKDTTHQHPPISFYDYFESPTYEEAQLFVSQLVQHIQSLGIQRVLVA